MDLLTFAVRQALANNGDLLPYVVDKRDVPVPVLEHSFRELLEHLVDARASQLVKDPDTLLGTEVPVLIKRDADGGYEIEGDIPDNLMEVIRTVHDKTQDAVVKSLVNYNMNMLYGQHCDVVSVELLSDKAKQTVTSLLDLPPIQPCSTVTTDVFEEPHEEAWDVLEATTEESLDVLEATTEEVTEDVFEEPHEEALNVLATATTEESLDVLEATTAESLDVLEATTEEVTEDVLDTLDVLATATTEEASEDTLEEPMDADAEEFRASVRRIYMKLVADIKSFGLDKRLSLTI